MVTRTRRGDGGFSLVEMMLVVAMFGVALSVVFGSVQVLTKSASSNMEQSAAAHDLSYSMELLSKAIMSGRLMYANDYRVMMLTQLADGTYQMNSVYTTAGADPTRGNLVWERWGSNSGGTALSGGAHTTWVMSDRNVNATTDPSVPLFAFYTAVADASLMPASGKSASPDSSMSAFAGTLPGGYPISAVGRIRLHVLAAFNNGMRDDTRDIVLRVRS
ncbi:MAG TPA: prepilin-type N-terminal cleavage/methylation domain-containing protein [Coriobacteriia bacterium]